MCKRENDLNLQTNSDNTPQIDHRRFNKYLKGGWVRNIPFNSKLFLFELNVYIGNGRTDLIWPIIPLHRRRLIPLSLWLCPSLSWYLSKERFSNLVIVLNVMSQVYHPLIVIVNLYTLVFLHNYIKIRTIIP